MKTCKCGTEFMQFTTMQNCCVDCLADRIAKKREANVAKDKKAAKRTVKERLIELKPLAYWEDRAQAAVNRYVVQGRDRDLPCISCGTTNPNIQYCASHYRSRKAANQLRYNEDNLHKSCNHRCNMMLSGNIENYRPALIAKIGQDRHDALINNHETKRWSIDECKGIEATYKLKLKIMLANKLD